MILNGRKIIQRTALNKNTINVIILSTSFLHINAFLYLLSTLFLFYKKIFKVFHRPFLLTFPDVSCFLLTFCSLTFHTLFKNVNKILRGLADLVLRIFLDVFRWVKKFFCPLADLYFMSFWYVQTFLTTLQSLFLLYRSFIRHSANRYFTYFFIIFSF